MEKGGQNQNDGNLEKGANSGDFGVSNDPIMKLLQMDPDLRQSIRDTLHSQLMNQQ